MSIKLPARDEKPTECPLCMESLEADDIHFYPCKCGYQICLFCWHRIKTDENGLCPACRTPYAENPVGFKSLSSEELQQLKNEKRQKELQKKQKLSESRKHLQSLRVVQKNLVFVVGLPARLAEPETLKRPEYFGKYGKIHKAVVNTTTGYAGVQGPSSSAYITYTKPEDALKAIQNVNNVIVDGRTVKASLGTTKYCSFYLKHHQCLKTGRWASMPDSGLEFHGHKTSEELKDCMYLHEIGDEAASFTKEEMQNGKHLEYEKRLHEQMLMNEKANNEKSQKLDLIGNNSPEGFSAISPTSQPSSSQICKNKLKREEPKSPEEKSDRSTPNISQLEENCTNQFYSEHLSQEELLEPLDISNKSGSSLSSPSTSPYVTPIGSLPEGRTPPPFLSSNSLEFSRTYNHKEADWPTTSTDNLHEDDLGFDPCEESTKALAEMLKFEAEEKLQQFTNHHIMNGQAHQQPIRNSMLYQPPSEPLHHRSIPNPPPGFQSPANGAAMRPSNIIYKENGFPEVLLPPPGNYMMARHVNNNDIFNSGIVNSPQMLSHMNSSPHIRLISQNSSNSPYNPLPANRQQQEELRKMLPNVKISFGPQSNQQELNQRPQDVLWTNQDYRENFHHKLQQLHLVNDRVAPSQTILNQKVTDKSWSYQQPQAAPPGFLPFTKYMADNNRKGVQSYYNGQQAPSTASSYTMNKFPYV